MFVYTPSSDVRIVLWGESISSFKNTIDSVSLKTFARFYKRDVIARNNDNYFLLISIVRRRKRYLKIQPVHNINAEKSKKKFEFIEYLLNFFF